MSAKITVNATIEAPLELAAAMQAAANNTGDFKDVAGTEGVKDNMITAVVDAFKAFPYRIQLPPTPAENSGPALIAQEASHYHSRQAIIPGSRSRSRSPSSHTSSATTTSFHIHVRGLFNCFIVYAEPTTTIGQLKEMIQSKDGRVFFSCALVHKDQRLCSADERVRKRNMTLQALGLRGGETIDLVPQASAEWDGSFEWENGAIELMEELEREAVKAEMDDGAESDESDDESDDESFESEQECFTWVMERRAKWERLG
ncbi:hypothetical protein AC578_6421 [Pseudocercospora eumusae]|uniref:Ubiquitin-like domain-containing protein n=1 Tax=Pseudocercospora eumusae TaxID=321146 RepID=A0A139H6S8_9PEZI|nr:hypothetical protein AC578_6421 [Pseudocercospora eumusae]